MAAELRDARVENQGLEARLREEKEERGRMLGQMEAVEAQAEGAAARNTTLQRLVVEAAEKRQALEERLQSARDGMEQASV